MPVYTFRCPKCGCVQDVHMSPYQDKYLVCECGTDMARVFNFAINWKGANTEDPHEKFRFENLYKE